MLKYLEEKGLEILREMREKNYTGDVDICIIASKGAIIVNCGRAENREHAYRSDEYPEYVEGI